MSKRISVLALAVMVTLSATTVATAQSSVKKSSGAAKAETTKAPRLTVVEPIKDFGTVAKGDKLEWNFEVKNTGNADLEIIAARPACGCTVSDFDRVVKPGQTGKVHAVVDTTAFTGPIAKSVTVETNDPSTPTAQVTISAVVKPYVEAHPAGFVRFNLLQGNTESQVITLYSEEEEPFEIVKIDSPQEWLKVEQLKVDPAQVITNVGRPGQNQYRVRVTAGGPEARLGPIAEKIRITTNSKHQPEYMLTVSGVVRPTFKVEPSGVNFGEVTPTESAATRTVVLRTNNLQAPDSFVVSKAESSVPGVSASVKPTANKGEYEVTLQLDKNAKPGDVNGEVKIFTNDAVRPQVVVPVKASVKAAAAAPAK
jgi:hypothetical protein